MSAINPVDAGKNYQLITATPTAAGTLTKVFTLDADGAFIILYLASVASTINVKVYTHIGHVSEGKRLLLQDFGSLTAADAGVLIFRKTASTTSQLHVEVTYDDACSYEVWIRGAAQSEASVRLLGANNGIVSSTTVTTTPTNVIPSALTDRAGIIIWNNSTTIKIFWGYTSSEATLANGMPLLPQTPLGIDMAQGANIFMRSESGTVDIRIAEASS